MATDDYISAAADEGVSAAGRYMAMMAALGDYSVPESLRRKGEDGTSAKFRMDSYVREIVVYLKSWAFHAQDSSAEIGRIVPCGEDEICKRMLFRARALGLARDEVRPVVKFVVGDVLLNRGVIRTVGTPSEEGLVWEHCRLAVAERGGVRLENEFLAALSRLFDIEKITGIEFDVLDLIIKSRVESGTREDVIEAFRYANTVLGDQMVGLSALRDRIRNREKFQEMDPVKTGDDLKARRERMEKFLEEDLPRYFSMFCNMKDNAEAVGEAAQGDARVRQAMRAMESELQAAKKAVGRLLELFDAVLEDITLCARASRSFAERGFLSIDREVTDRLGELSFEILGELPAFLLRPIVLADAPGLCYPDMLLDFRASEKKRPERKEFDLSVPLREDESLFDEDIRGETRKTMEKKLLEVLSKKEETTLSEFLDGLEAKEYESFMDAGPDFLITPQKGWTVALKGCRVLRSRSKSGSEKTVVFDDVVFGRRGEGES